ncbi:hypothetical protein ACROYT_G015750 [Oculina patagonica]
MSREEDFQNFLQRSQSEEKSEEQRRSEEGLPNFKLNFCDLLEGKNFPDVADLEQPGQDSSQELESFISAEKYETRSRRRKVNGNEINCATAQFGQNANGFDKFVEKCAPAAWRGFFNLPYVKTEVETISRSLKTPNIQPPMSQTLKALELVDPDDIKVVIIGQDPTPKPNQATGLAFSVTDPRKVGSVLNVLLEVALEGWSVDITNGDLTKWAEQGVLLLNSALTVQQN